MPFGDCVASSLASFVVVWDCCYSAVVAVAVASSSCVASFGDCYAAVVSSSIAFDGELGFDSFDVVVVVGFGGWLDVILRELLLFCGELLLLSCASYF